MTQSVSQLNDVCRLRDSVHHWNKQPLFILRRRIAKLLWPSPSRFRHGFALKRSSLAISFEWSSSVAYHFPTPSFIYQVWLKFRRFWIRNFPILSPLFVRIVTSLDRCKTLLHVHVHVHAPVLPSGRGTCNFLRVLTKHGSRLQSCVDCKTMLQPHLKFWDSPLASCRRPCVFRIYILQTLYSIRKYP